MKGIAILVLCASLCAIALARPEGELFPTKYDDTNLDDILHNERLLTSFYNCLMHDGPCTPEGAELKKYLPEAIKNECAQCSEKQKAGAIKVANYIIDNKPEWYKEIEETHDPTGSYRRQYEARGRELGVHV